MNQRNAARNREIFASYLEGATHCDLAEQHGLAQVTIRQIIDAERNLLAVSANPIYRAARAECHAERQ